MGFIAGMVMAAVICKNSTSSGSGPEFQMARTNGTQHFFNGLMCVLFHKIQLGSAIHG
jgi:hypothetical protein